MPIRIVDQGADMSRWELVRAWELAYARYPAASEAELSSVSRAVAAAWRHLAAEFELPAWAHTAVISAAEAFEIQADKYSVRGEEGHVDHRMGRVRRDVGRRPARGTDGRGDWFGADESADAGARGGAVRGDSPAAGRSGDVASVRDVPSPAPRRRGGSGCASRSPRDGSAGA